MSKLNPIGDKILVQPIEEQKMSAGGIIIPVGNDGKTPQRGVVVAVGPGLPNSKGEIIKPNLEVGDTVIFQNGAGQELKLDGNKFLIMTEHNVFAKVANE